MQHGQNVELYRQYIDGMEKGIYNNSSDFMQKNIEYIFSGKQMEELFAMMGATNPKNARYNFVTRHKALDVKFIKVKDMERYVKYLCSCLDNFLLDSVNCDEKCESLHIAWRYIFYGIGRNPKSEKLLIYIKFQIQDKTRILQLFTIVPIRAKYRVFDTTRHRPGIERDWTNIMLNCFNKKGYVIFYDIRHRRKPSKPKP